MVVSCGQALSQIRTVYSFVGESKAATAYAKALQTTLSIANRVALLKGLSVGIMHGTLIGVWALLFWYSSILVLRGVTYGGKAFRTIVCSVVSGL